MSQGLSVNPSAAGGRLSHMPRRRRFLERPHAHLHAAALAHERLHSDDAGDGEPAVEPEGEGTKSRQSEHAKTQRRDTEGKFA